MLELWNSEWILKKHMGSCQVPLQARWWYYQKSNGCDVIIRKQRETAGIIRTRKHSFASNKDRENPQPPKFNYYGSIQVCMLHAACPSPQVMDQKPHHLKLRDIAQSVRKSTARWMSKTFSACRPLCSWIRDSFRLALQVSNASEESR